MTNDERIVPLQKLKTNEEYSETRAYFEKLVKEYNDLFCGDKDPKALARDDFKDKIENVHKGMSLEEEKKLHEAKTKYIMTSREVYKSNLLENITGTLLMMEEFEARQEKRPFIEIARGVLSGDDDVKEYLRKKYSLDLANMYGLVPATKNIYVESMDDILDYMEKNYEFVDVDLSDRHEKPEEEKGLTIYSEQPTAIKEAVIKSIRKNSQRVFSDMISNNQKENSEYDANASKESDSRVKAHGVSKEKSEHEKGEFER